MVHHYGRNTPNEVNVPALMEMQRSDSPPFPGRPECSVLALAAAQLRATADVLCMLSDQLGMPQNGESAAELIAQARSLITKENLATPPDSGCTDGFAEHLLNIKLRAT